LRQEFFSIFPQDVVSYPGAIVPYVVKIDVEAVGAMLDEMLAVPSRSPFEELEPDY